MNSVLRAITEVQNFVVSGTLPPEGWSWIMESRFVFIAKKSGVVSRPIQLGEIWRRLISKH